MFARRRDRLVSWNHIHVGANTLVEMVHRLGGCVLLGCEEPSDHRDGERDYYSGLGSRQRHGSAVRFEICSASLDHGPHIWLQRSRLGLSMKAVTISERIVDIQ